ncbi:MAG: hypothetical protein AVDCRST_MAG40-1927 [uncultured Gemmatimonadaceae bacterium]|uniref:Uncharacterized protein n=1 Tax=uncultured Gemmatimonadaceae bacterium TaxID=246130 RepID=A0A6J4LF19_9BACT|nr:MAG: hypothetical protein AVDCRST_MAG40-1927 [uncultured Gemmatimonadaceae bacterium]
MTSHGQRPLAGLPAAPADELTAYHSEAREAALEAFGRAYEQGLLDGAGEPAGGSGPAYVIAGGADEELLVLAGVWPAAGIGCGRLVAPRELLALLLDDPATSAVWCDEEQRDCLALSASAARVDGEAMLLIVARSARLVGETPAGAELAFDEERVRQAEWTAAAIDAYLRDHDGDALLAAERRLGEIAAKIRE